MFDSVIEVLDMPIGELFYRLMRWDKDVDAVAEQWARYHKEVEQHMTSRYPTSARFAHRKQQPNVRYPWEKENNIDA